MRPNWPGPENLTGGIFDFCMSVFIAVKGLFISFRIYLTLVLLNQDIPAFANSVDPDQLASEEAN